MSHRTSFLWLPLFALLGCERGDSFKTEPPPESAQSVIVVAGDESAAGVITALRKGNITVTDDKTSIASASLVVIAQDSMKGPMPVHRELVEEIAATGNRNVLWIQTKSSEIDDQELLELEELEVRELLNDSGLPGDIIQFAVDSDSAPVDPRSPNLRGWTSITRFVLRHRKE